MKVFQCSSGGMVPTIPTVFPSCYSLQTAATPQDSDAERLLSARQLHQP